MPADQMDPETKTVPGQGTDKPRCKDCDEDCWHVPDKLHCWLGGRSSCGKYETDLAEGYCPWLMEGIEFPPKP